MCGILGFVGHKLNTQILIKAAELMNFRGPDYGGIYQKDKINLAHRRLSIIDLSDNGNQPMFNENKKVSIVFNGEIYNYRQLRKLLNNYRFQSTTDTEVLIHGYEEWGLDGLLRRITGMYAFAICDERIQSTYIVTDPMGQKPLYYREKNGKFGFSSTIESLLCLEMGSVEINEEAAYDFFIQAFITGPHTIYKEIFKLEPATFLTYDWSTGLVKKNTYWQPKITNNSNLNDHQILEQSKSLLKDSIEKRLVSDVPLGAFLSGGIDSSLICSILTKDLGYDVNTFTVKFDNAKYDESEVATSIADHLGIKNKSINFDINLTEELSTIIANFGQPFGDHSVLPTYLLAKNARSDVTVALTGDGGDESFAGYNTSLALAAAEKFKRLLHNDVFCSLFDYTLGRISKKARWIASINKDGFIYDPMGDRGFRKLLQSVINNSERAASIIKKVDSYNSHIWNSHNELSWLDRGLMIDLTNKLPNNMLVKLDVATMSSGLEARSPFMDKDLVEFALSIPSKRKIQGLSSKSILRKLLKNYLPDEIINRPKKGFSLPVDQWIVNNREFVNDIISTSYTDLDPFFKKEQISCLLDKHFNQKTNYGRQIWLILVFSMWLQNRGFS